MVFLSTAANIGSFLAQTLDFFRVSQISISNMFLKANAPKMKCMTFTKILNSFRNSQTISWFFSMFSNLKNSDIRYQLEKIKMLFWNSLNSFLVSENMINDANPLQSSGRLYNL